MLFQNLVSINIIVKDAQHQVFSDSNRPSGCFCDSVAGSDKAEAVNFSKLSIQHPISVWRRDRIREDCVNAFIFFSDLNLGVHIVEELPRWSTTKCTCPHGAIQVLRPKRPRQQARLDGRWQRLSARRRPTDCFGLRTRPGWVAPPD